MTNFTMVIITLLNSIMGKIIIFSIMLVSIIEISNMIQKNQKQLKRTTKVSKF